jgi:hypothetical protein
MELTVGVKSSSKKADWRAIETETRPKNKRKNAIDFILCCIDIVCCEIPSKRKSYKQEGKKGEEVEEKIKI